MGRIAQCAAQVQRFRQQGLAAYSGYFCGVYEEAKFWLDDEEVLTLPYDDPDRLTKVLDAITDLCRLHDRLPVHVAAAQSRRA